VQKIYEFRDAHEGHTDGYKEHRRCQHQQRRRDRFVRKWFLNHRFPFGFQRFVPLNAASAIARSESAMSCAFSLQRWQR
jgi:hypothetical protein